MIATTIRYNNEPPPPLSSVRQTCRKLIIVSPSCWNLKPKLMLHPRAYKKTFVAGKFLLTCYSFSPLRSWSLDFLAQLLASLDFKSKQYFFAIQFCYLLVSERKFRTESYDMYVNMAKKTMPTLLLLPWPSNVRWNTLKTYVTYVCVVCIKLK